MPEEKCNINFSIISEETQWQLFDWDDYRIGHFIQKNKLKSNTNDDCLFLKGDIDNRNILLGIADGAGGHPKAQEAATIVGQEFSKYNFSNDTILGKIENINKQILDLKVGAHTTLAMVTIEDNILRCYSIGDSEIIYWNANGTIHYNNIPQTIVGHSIEAGHIHQSDAIELDDRNVVNHLLGDKSLRLEVFTGTEVKKGHTLLIGSDGLFDNISHKNLTKLVSKGSFEKSFEDLVEECQQQSLPSWNKDDDVSFILLRKIKA